MDGQTKFLVCSTCFKIIKYGRKCSCSRAGGKKYRTLDKQWNYTLIKELAGPEPFVHAVIDIEGRTLQRKRARRLLNIARNRGWENW